MDRYQKYLNSDEWQVVRARILKRAKGRCEKCRHLPPKQVHHKTYVRLGNERDSDLTALCVPCHQKEHPDKEILSGSFLGEHACRMCPNEQAEIFLGDTEIIYLCTRCGESERMPFKARQRRSRPRRKAPPPVPLSKDEKQRLRWDERQRAHEAAVRKRAEKRRREKATAHWTF